MNTLIWILQIILALLFLYSGAMKSTQDREKLMSLNQTGVANLSYASIRFIGISEILGAVGIILPLYLQVIPVLTPIAAACFAVVMVFAIRIHYKRSEFKQVTFNIIIFLMAIGVAFYRFSELG